MANRKKAKKDAPQPQTFPDRILCFRDSSEDHDDTILTSTGLEDLCRSIPHYGDSNKHLVFAEYRLVAVKRMVQSFEIVEIESNN